MANDILIKIGADISDFSRKMAESNKALSNFGKANAETFDAFKKTGAAVTGAGVALAGGLGFAVKTAANFEEAMSNVKAISGATGEEFNSLRDKAMEMGAKTAYSASESADAMANLAQMGWKTDDILAGIEHTLNLAAAGNLDLADASMIAANTINQFGLEAGDAERVADVMAATASSAGTDVEEMAHALQYAGANASAAGMDIEQTAAFIGVLGDAGISGSKAGTALNAMLRDLKKNAEDGALAVGEQTVALYDANGEMRPMPDVISEIIRATEKMSDEQRDAALSALFGEQALGAFNAIAGQGADAVSDLAKELYNAGGTAQDMADIQMDNLNGALTELSSAFEGMQISIGSALIPVIREVTEWIKGLVEWFNDLSETTKQKIAIFMALSSILLIVGGGFLLLIGFVPQIISGFQAVTTVVRTAGLAFAGLNLPMLAIVGTIGIVVASIVHLWRTNEEFRNNVTEIWTNIQTLIAGVWEAIKPGAMAFISILMALIGVMAQVIGWVVGIVASFTSWIISFIQTHSWVMTLIQVLAVITGVIAGLVAVVTVVVKVFTALVAIVKVVGIVLAFLTSPIGLIIAGITALVAAIIWLGGKFEWLGNLLDGVANFMSNAWNKFLGFFGNGTKDAADEASNAIEGVSEKGQEDLSALADGGVASTEELNAGVTSNISDMTESSSNMLGDMSLEGIDSLESLNINGIDAMADMNVGVTSEIGDMSNISLDDLSSLEIDGIGAMSGLEKGVTSNVGDMTSEVKSQIGGMESKASGDFSGLAKDMSKNAEQIKKSVTTAFADIATTVKKTMDDINKASSSGLKSFGANITKSMSDVSKTINTAMQKISLTIKQSFSVINKAVNTATMRMSQAITKGFTNISRITSTSLNANTRLFTTSFNRQNNIVKTSVNRTVQTYSSGSSRVNQIISSGMARALTTINNTGARMTASVRRLNAQFYSAGVQAMEGLRSGLNAGSDSVMATARSIANRVASTVRAALRVQSPSRVLMEIGKWTSIGLAEGIEDYAYLVDKASDMLAESAIPDVKNIDLSYATPDGITAGGLVGAVSGTVDVNSRDDMLAASIASLERKLTNLTIVMDEREVARATSNEMNRELGRKQANSARRVFA